MSETTKYYSATIGFFDGVHRGHQYVISRLRSDAELHGMGSMIITFRQHPRQVLQSDYIPQLLSPGNSKRELLEQTNVDKVEMLDFTIEMSRMSAREFMQMMHDRLSVRRLLIGYDNRFGHNRQECFEDYKRYGEEIGIEVVLNNALAADGDQVSSSLVRRLLSEGEVTAAAHCLGRAYSFSGLVVHGKGEGRKIGFPTANMQVAPEQLIPKRGVYAVSVSIDGYDEEFRGMMNIGVRPTYGVFAQTLEVNIFNFSDDIYGRIITVRFIRHIRDEHRFNSIEELTHQLQADKQAIEQKK